MSQPYPLTALRIADAAKVLDLTPKALRRRIDRARPDETGGRRLMHGVVARKLGESWRIVFER